MTVYMSCGHTDEYRPVSGWPIRFRSEEPDYFSGLVPAVTYAIFCRDCYLQWVKDYPEEIIFEDYEEAEYLEGEDK